MRITVTVISSGSSRNSRGERAAHESGPLDEVGERGGEIRVGLDLAAHLAGEGTRPLEDRDPPRLGVGLDVRVTELREVVVRPGHREIALGEHAVPHRAVGRGHAEERERNDLPPVERDDAAHRAHEAARAFAPAHRLRKRQARDDFRQDLARGPRRRRARESSCGRPRSFRAANRRRRGPRRPPSAPSRNRRRPSWACRPCRRRWIPAARGPRPRGPPASREARGRRARGGGAFRTIRSSEARDPLPRAPRPSRGRAPAAPAAAPAPGSPPCGSPIRSPGRSCPLVIAARAKPHVRKTLRSRRARRAPSQTVAGSGSDFGDRCPSFPET